ncbi:MAG TPA: cupin domain-containing protein [Polyangiaceae bacterium]|nr:cupin domain-containing protein [Polyangiaceae bacterium]
MLERLAFGELPAKHHLALRGAGGQLFYEACLTRKGFDGPYSILYHQHRPQALRAVSAAVIEPLEAAERAPRGAGLSRRHFRTLAVGSGQQPRVPLLFNADLVLGCFRPTQNEGSYRINAGADELSFVLQGRGTLRSALGDVEFAAGDYLFVPKGLLHRFVFAAEAPHLLFMEFPGGVGVPQRFRNPAGQLRMDAPYCHRDFVRPRFEGPKDEGLREVWVQRGVERQRFAYEHNPLDVVGWDGSVYPFAFPISRFQPRVSSVHLPPTWHGTFEAQGALICSFVPRPLDFHPEAIPCPYAHTSADVDEVLFYVDGDFSSRLGVERGSLTLHPGGIPHGPHPGRYEASIGAKRTEEVAVMLDCTSRLNPTSQALSIEDANYENSFTDGASS